MYGLGVNKLGVNNTADPIAKLFASGSEGAWYDPSDLSTLFQEDGTTPAVVDGVVGKVLDKSGNGNHLVQTVQTKCPILRLGTSGGNAGLYYLDFDGTDDGLETSASIDFTSTTDMSVFTGAQKTITATNQNVLELSGSVGSNAGTFRVFCTSGDEWRAIQKGTVANVLTSAAVGNPNRAVLTSTASISAPSHVFRRDGAEEASNTASLGTGTFGNHKLNVGARSDGSSANLDGSVFAVVVVDRVCTDSEIAAVEEYVARKTGVSI
jgi:hypothetical protein